MGLGTEEEGPHSAWLERAACLSQRRKMEEGLDPCPADWQLCVHKPGPGSPKDPGGEAGEAMQLQQVDRALDLGLANL